MLVTMAMESHAMTLTNVAKEVITATLMPPVKIQAATMSVTAMKVIPATVSTIAVTSTNAPIMNLICVILMHHAPTQTEVTLAVVTLASSVTELIVLT